MPANRPVDRETDRGLQQSGTINRVLTFQLRSTADIYSMQRYTDNKYRWDNNSRGWERSRPVYNICKFNIITMLQRGIHSPMNRLAISPIHDINFHA